MKIISIVGARPQFIKVAPICHKMAENGIESIIIHTGQHYDYQLSDIFFDELNIPAPDFNLEIGEQKPVMQISQIIKGLFPIIEEVKPDCAIVYGDTNSTLAASISLVKQNIPIIHIEGGERNFTSDMKLVNSTTIPEETNRILTDHISELIFCATSRAVTNLENEGIVGKGFFVGDVMLDSFILMSDVAKKRSKIITNLNLKKGEYYLATVHRAINTDSPDRLREILLGLINLKYPVIFPLHPRTKKVIEKNKIFLGGNESPIKFIEPVGYFDMIELEKNAKVIITDSGGVTRESYFAGVPSIIVDDSTAWIDLVKCGWSKLVGANSENIENAMNSPFLPINSDPILGSGDTSTKIIKKIVKWYGLRK